MVPSVEASSTIIHSISSCMEFNTFSAVNRKNFIELYVAVMIVTFGVDILRPEVSHRTVFVPTRYVFILSILSHSKILYGQHLFVKQAADSLTIVDQCKTTAPWNRRVHRPFLLRLFLLTYAAFPYTLFE